ncbi:MAG: hypothetical protein CVU42_08430 [Chloroflexi bacterium HGW-Chloroflexi-4]|jgi:hypothetical protein|nr:MAG: hypothetical protein CVU42_08430 [Chloroflexi bacterium HGW-Chloroflexi-4]
MMIKIAKHFQLLSMRRTSELERMAAGDGREELGGKAQGLLSVHQTLTELDQSSFPEIKLDIPRLTVVGTSIFEAFIQRNGLEYIAHSGLSDTRIANAFQRGDMPFEALGELRALSDAWITPLAVRSSGLLEDLTERPFAGVYLTKMIPNNQADPDTRFAKMLEAIKFVWASTFFKIARDYCQATGLDICQEKMAVILQEVIGRKHGDRFYPELSGVARSYNFYPLKPAKPEDGVVNLALGLGKTIVDGGRCWIYSPAYPEMPPPYDSTEELLEETQTDFWMINMGEPPEFNPIKETEFLQVENLMMADKDGTLAHLASTYDPESERLIVGTDAKGTRALTFSPLLINKTIPVNALIKRMLASCETKLGCPVEVEFAMTFDPPRFGFLQVRPMAVPEGSLELTSEEMQNPKALASSEVVLGNGVDDEITDIVYVIPELFDLKNTRPMAEELDLHNHRLLDEGRKYLLIVFGRLGTEDSWLGIPVAWGQICGASVIIEATQQNVKVELSQGTHYFHNIINLGVKHFSMPFTSPFRVDWDWLLQQSVANAMHYTRHVRLTHPLHIKVDGRHGRGTIHHA